MTKNAFIDQRIYDSGWFVRMENNKFISNTKICVQKGLGTHGAEFLKYFRTFSLSPNIIRSNKKVDCCCFCKAFVQRVLFVHVLFLTTV